VLWAASNPILSLVCQPSSVFTAPHEFGGGGSCPDTRQDWVCYHPLQFKTLPEWPMLPEEKPESKTGLC